MWAAYFPSTYRTAQFIGKRCFPVRCDVFYMNHKMKGKYEISSIKRFHRVQLRNDTDIIRMSPNWVSSVVELHRGSHPNFLYTRKSCH